MGENCPKLLDLIPNSRKWGLNRDDDDEENKKLELRLGLLPGHEASVKWCQKNSYNNHPWHYKNLQSQEEEKSGFHHDHHDGDDNGVVRKESSLSEMHCRSRMVGLQQQNAENKASANTAVPNISQKRAAPAPVVGWPPIRSFRKNMASSKPQDPITTKPVNDKTGIEKNSQKGLFVKINMDGVPIGRKVDLNAYDSYDKLSSTVDKLFRGLLAAQRDSLNGGIDIENKQVEQKPITGLLDGSGEYTLVYEDNEGDRMLVGDVPWNMFVSTVKRLRVLKSSDLPTLDCGGSKEGKVRVEGALT